MTDKLPFKTWKYEEQTKIKHKVFEDYFDKWVKILGRYNKLNYIDGFGGCGAYEDQNGEMYYGSPVRAAQIINQNKISLGRDVKMVVIDQNKENLENIKKIFEYEKIDINPIFINNDFDQAVNKLLDDTPNIAPTFFFVDPFGFAIKMLTLKRIMNIKKSEIFLNFMFNGVARFLSLEQNKKTMNDLFDTDKWVPLAKLTGAEKENKIVYLYRSQLKKIAKFVFPYKLEFPDMQRTYYYLFHLTNHYKGASIMKSSFAKFNYGRVEYLGSRANQLRLSEIGNTKIQEVNEFLTSKYPKCHKKYIKIIEENIDETDYLESDIRNALKELEKTNKIYIERFPKLTEKKQELRRSIEENDIIYFDTFPNITRKSLLYETKVEYGNFTINHVFGCSHGCKYPCYAMMMANRYGKINNSEGWLHPKIVSNALELLEKEIPRYKNKIDFVHLSFTTDPFMYDELNKRTFKKIEELTLKIIQKLNENDIKCTVLTKGVFPEELTNTAVYNAKNEYGITLVSLGKSFKKNFEPHSAPFGQRIKSLKFLHDNGMKTWVSIEPYPTPNIDDEQDLSKLLDKISFADKIIFGKMNYNVNSSQFENNKEFYEHCANQVISFCKERNMGYHIKHGTMNTNNQSTENIFKKWQQRKLK